VQPRRVEALADFHIASPLHEKKRDTRPKRRVSRLLRSGQAQAPEARNELAQPEASEREAGRLGRIKNMDRAPEGRHFWKNVEVRD